MSADIDPEDEGFGVTVPETGACAICHGRYDLYGCDPDPVSCFGRACHTCEREIVIPAREFIHGLVEKRIKATRNYFAA